MRSSAIALGWEFRRRHRWPLIAVLAYMLVLAGIKLLGLEPVDPIRLMPPDGRGAMLIAPLSTVFVYYLAVFSFGFAGDLAARRSMFPARLLTLPVRTETLVRGPMLHGTGAVALMLLMATLLARWPWGIAAPLLWPAVLGAVVLAWTQALTWMPYGLPGMRVVVSVLCLVSLDAIVLLAMYFEVSEPVMLAILAPQLPLAYLTACSAIARARRGDVPDWRPLFARLLPARDLAARDLGARGTERFASAARAQTWLEWRRQGRTLPTMVAILLPVELALLWLATDAPLFVLEILIIVLLTPPLAAVVAAAMVSRASPEARDGYGVSPFLATRPSTSVALIAAKLRTALRSTLVAWILVLAATPLALRWSGTWPIVAERADALIDSIGMPRASALALLLLAGLVASTWKQLVQGMYIGMTGRVWMMRSTMIAVLAFVIFVAPVAQWMIESTDAQAALWGAIPTILAVLVACKMVAAALVAAQLVDRGLLSDRTLVLGALGWVATVFTLYGVLAWMVSWPHTPRYLLMLLAILVVPLARVAAAPLALAWNRHR